MLDDKIYDLIIIGGGINGAGIARDGAERGLSVILLEKGDFAGATSWTSTKLIHGGFRYLEHYEFSLVRESLREREALLKIAPHLVKPLPFVFPIYQDRRYSSSKVRLGMMVYDLLSLDKSLPSHHSLSAKDFLRYDSSINPEGLKKVYFYSDCQVAYPERLCLENVLAAKSYGARVVNYNRVIGIMVDDKVITGVRVQDESSGEVYELRGRTVVNASGPWVDEVCRTQNGSTPRKMGGTKGSHIVTRRIKNGPSHAIYVPAKRDGRPFVIVPWRDYHLIGTTDVRFEGNLDDIHADAWEVDYLLNEANYVLQGSKISESDVLFSFAGVRPLPYAGNKKEAEITRRHIIYDHERQEGIKGFISIIGGKLTTYRSLAQQTVNLVLKKLGVKPIPCRTAFSPLPGGGLSSGETLSFRGGRPSFGGVRDIEHYVKVNSEKGANYGLEADQITYLISLYGTRFKDVIALSEKNSELKERLCPHNPDIKAQVVYALEHELAQKAEDVLLRRTGIGTSACLGLDCVDQVVRLMGENLGWKGEQRKREVIEYKNRVDAFYRHRH